MAAQDLFANFNYALLDEEHFLEDSVREELVSPLITALGYSASPPHRIFRSFRLKHPYVYIGTVKKPISIIPDYLLQRDNQNAWVLDAKGPKEIIDSGKNVEQAFSYAIHKDVRVPIYALCNGRRLTVFHVSHWPSILDIELRDIPQTWPLLLDLLGTKAAWPTGRAPGFLPDLGLTLRKAGLDRDKSGQKYLQIFLSVEFQHISRVEDDLYSASSPYVQEYAPSQFTASMLTCDFDSGIYQNLLLQLPNGLREQVRKALSRQPYNFLFPEDEATPLTVYADPGDHIYENANESYCPFIVREFIAESRTSDETKL